MGISMVWLRYGLQRGNRSIMGISMVWLRYGLQRLLTYLLSPLTLHVPMTDLEMAPNPKPYVVEWASASGPSHRDAIAQTSEEFRECNCT